MTLVNAGRKFERVIAEKRAHLAIGVAVGAHRSHRAQLRRNIKADRTRQPKNSRTAARSFARQKRIAVHVYRVKVRPVVSKFGLDFFLEATVMPSEDPPADGVLNALPAGGDFAGQLATDARQHSLSQIHRPPTRNRYRLYP